MTAPSQEVAGPKADEDWFGYVPFAFSATCAQFVVRPVEDLQQHVSAINSKTNQDGFYYPLATRYREDPLTQELTRIPTSTRPALLYRMPHTHVIATRSGVALPQNFRSGVGGLLIHILALLYETRCQFWNWWFESRIRTKADRIASFRDDESTLSRVLSMAHATWESWPSERARKLYINALWLHSRLPVYRFDWERFLMAYVVSDALWALTNELDLLASRPRVPHAERLEHLIGALGLVPHPDVIQRFAALRNDLFHEGLWDEQTPGTAASPEAFLAEIRLRSLNARILLALGGVRCGFLRTNWMSMSTFELGVA